MKILLKRYPERIAFLVMLSMLWSVGCGGQVTTTPTAPGSAPTADQKAVIALNTSGSLPSGTTIGGLGVTLNLPDSVTVKTDASGNVDNSAVATSGVAAGQATVITLYTKPSGTVPAKLHIVLASGSAGMQVGEFAKITCSVSTGDTPTASDFSLSEFSPVDTSGAVIPSLAAGLSTISP
jgi:hypothetical protein